MSKRRKRKPSRRERQAGVDRPVRRPDVPQADPAPTAAADKSATADRSPADFPDSITATFKPTAKSEATVELEQQYVSHDLKRLLVQLAVFSVAVIGLAVLNAQTDLISDFGSSVVGLWE